MELANIVRKMDKYEFSFDNGKFASVDVEAKEFIGTTGKQIKSIPQSIPCEMRDYLKMRLRDNDNNLKEIVDRILSLADVNLDVKLFYVGFFSVVPTYLFINQMLEKSEWKILLQVIREETEIHGNYCYYRTNELKQKMNLIKLKPIIEKYNLQEYAEYINLNYPQFLEIKAFRSALRHTCKDPYEKYQNQVKAILNCDDEKILRDCCGIEFKKYNIQSEVSKLYSGMRKAEEYRTKLNLENFEYTNIERDMKNLETMYKAEKTKIDDRFFANNQSKYNLNYENEQYKVYVPMNRKELAKIGNWFHNCANAWEWDTRLCDGSYFIVAILDKNNERLVCCDICANNMKIEQYKGKYNSIITDKSLNAFKKEYQSHLDGLKGE